MGLTSKSVLILAIMMSVALPVASLVFWNRLGPHRWVVWPARTAFLAGAQVSAVVVVALLINNAWGFYGSWSELLGRTRPTVSSVKAISGSLDAGLRARLVAAYRSGHGTVITIPIPGVTSHVRSLPALVYLPPQYGNPNVRQDFPVVEMLGGFPGGPQTWFKQLALRQTIDASIRDGSSVPFILVAPTMNVALPRDTECVNVTHGPKAETYLSADVRRAVTTAFRAERDRSHWGAMGYSTGGYCSLELALHHPDLFSAAVSMSGYVYPAHDRTTGDLFGHSAARRLENSPAWLLAHRPQPNVSLLVMTSRQDHHSFRDDHAFTRLARAPLSMWTLTMARGGHNATFWRSLEPTAFGWLSRRLIAALTPLPTVNGAQPVQVPPVPDEPSRLPRHVARPPVPGLGTGR